MSGWSPETESLLFRLHKEIALNEKNWHKLKNNKKRRAAELLVSSLIKIIKDKDDNEIQEQIVLSLKWLRDEVEFQKCESKRS